MFLYASSALPPPFLADDGIFLGEWVPSGAVSSQSGNHIWRSTAPGVLGTGYQLHMRRIDTGTALTKMIDDQTRGDRSDALKVISSMNVGGFALIFKYAVAVSVDRAEVAPAPIFLNDIILKLKI